MQDGHGGKFKVSTLWLVKLCCAMGLTVRARTTAAQKLPEVREEHMLRMNQRVAVLVFKYKVPPEGIVKLSNALQKVWMKMRNVLIWG